MKKLKAPTIVFLVLSIIFILGCAGTFVAYDLVVAKNAGTSAMDGLKSQFLAIGGAYGATLDPSSDLALQFTGICLMVGINPTLISGVVIGLAGLIFILLMVGLSVCLNKKKGWYLFYGLDLLLALTLMHLFISNVFYFLPYIKGDYPQETSLVIISWVLMIGVPLMFILVMITYFLGLALASKNVVYRYQKNREKAVIFGQYEKPDEPREVYEEAAPRDDYHMEPEPVYEQPAPQPAPQPEPVVAPVMAEPVYEEPQQESLPQENDDFWARLEEFVRRIVREELDRRLAEGVVVAPAPVEEEVPQEELPASEELPLEEKMNYERIPFADRIAQADDELLAIYSELKNEILAYGVKSRISANGDTFRLHKKMYARITVAGKSLKLYFALDPQKYADSTIPVQDASGKAMYQEIPLMFKVKSGLSIRRCKKLIEDVMKENALEKGEVGNEDWGKQLKEQFESSLEE